MPAAVMILTGRILSLQLMPAMPIAVVRLGGDDPGHPRAVPVVVARVGVVVHEVVAGAGRGRRGRGGWTRLPCRGPPRCRMPPLVSDHASRTRIRSSEYWPAVFGSLTDTAATVPSSVDQPDARSSARRIPPPDRRAARRARSRPGGPRSTRRPAGPRPDAPSSSSDGQPVGACATRAPGRVAPLDDDLAGDDLAARSGVWGARGSSAAAGKADASRQEEGEERWRGLVDKLCGLRCGPVVPGSSEPRPPAGCPPYRRVPPPHERTMVAGPNGTDGPVGDALSLRQQLQQARDGSRHGPTTMADAVLLASLAARRWCCRSGSRKTGS